MRLKNSGKEIIIYSDRNEISQYDYYLITMQPPKIIIQNVIKYYSKNQVFFYAIN